MYVNNVLRQYGLPSTMDLLDASYTKAQLGGHVQGVPENMIHFKS